MTKQIKRGDIYFADLDPPTGSEQGGTRPVLVVQNDVGNRFSPTVIVVPLTSRKKAYIPTHVKISRTGKLRTDSIALAEHPRAIDCVRLLGYIGRVDGDTLATVSSALSLSLELSEEKARKAPSPILDLTLCGRCVSEFEDAGRILMKRDCQEYKESCDKCHVGMGWYYDVFEKGENIS